MKRRHIDREMNGHMLQMSIQDSRATAPESTCIRDEDMTHGNSYEIAPDRIYVHSLDDDDDNPEVTDNSWQVHPRICLLYTSPSPRDRQKSRMPSSA